MAKRKHEQVGVIATRPFNSRVYAPNGELAGIIERSQSKRHTEAEGTNAIRLNPDYALNDFHVRLMLLEYIAQNPEVLPEVETTKRPQKPLVSPMARAAWIAAQDDVKARHMTVGAVLNMLTSCARIEAARLRAGIAPSVPYDKPGFGRRAAEQKVAKKKSYNRKLGTSSKRG